MAGNNVRDHKYHAEATAIRGTLERPYPALIEPQAHAKVRPVGGYESQHGEPFRIEEVVSYSAARTQAAGHQESEKKGKVFKTLATAVVEDLNILNVITCDRVVGQISTEHPLNEEEGHVPKVTFLGSQFFNLRIAGYPVEVEVDLDLFDPTLHSAKTQYTKNQGFLDRVAARLGIFRPGKETDEAKASPVIEVPTFLKERYGNDPRDKNGAESTIVKSISTKGPFAPIGHVFDIPNFGQIHLGVLRIEHSDHELDIPRTTLFDVSMFEIHMGCIGSGQLNAACMISNGGSGPPKPGGTV